MNSNMLGHEAVQQNLRLLTARGVRFVEPGEGYLACGWIGKGRLAEPAEVVAGALDALAPAGSTLRGRRVLVTAGPTYEDIDPVRYVGNRSSGRMGFALAAEARRRGATVTLIAGPTTLEPPPTDEFVRVRSAARDARGGLGGREPGGRRHHGCRRGRLHGGRSRITEDLEDRRTGDTGPATDAGYSR